MVSVIVCVVSVWLVIEPCVKFGTTGTAWAATAVVKTAAALVTINVIVFPKRMFTGILHYQSITVISETNCPVAVVPAPPAVTVRAPVVPTVPARAPAEPAV
jgi:hypothetical protein